MCLLWVPLELFRLGITNLFSLPLIIITFTTMMSLRTLIAALFLVSVAAFVPQKPVPSTPATVMHFKFLKEMGLEKPSWLPDFGGKKEEEPVPVAVAEEPTEEEGSEDAEEE